MFVAMVAVYPCMVVYSSKSPVGIMFSLHIVLASCDVCCVHTKECVLVAVVMLNVCLKFCFLEIKVYINIVID